MEGERLRRWLQQASFEIDAKEASSPILTVHMHVKKGPMPTVFVKRFREIALGNRPNTHFNKSGWTNLVENFKEYTGRDYDRLQLKNKWDQLKKEWKLWKDLKKGAGRFGWNSKRKTIDASDEWWKGKIEMDLQNTAFTIQLGRGANIQLANDVINTGSSRATFQFGSVDFPTVIARAAATSAYSTDSERHIRRPHSAARRAHLSAPRATTAQDPHRRIFVFERLSESEALATKRIVTGGRISVVTTNTTTLPIGVPVPRKNDAEASSSGERLTRRQRRKLNAKN
ncbi:hypothetical protein M5K25_013399 [Dendrobium thyrsiflorum]|uniref:Myb/SANT-like domain-containing protein n=1 Tax=Dendrobium thyrsiflorum TaxID=117978 RepID=A0ABD0UT64_DENTH